MIKMYNVLIYIENEKGQQIIGVNTAGMADILLNYEQKKRVAPDGWLRCNLSDTLTFHMQASNIGDVTLWQHVKQEMQKVLGKLFVMIMLQDKVKFALLRQDLPKSRFRQFVTKCLKMNAKLM